MSCTFNCDRGLIQTATLGTVATTYPRLLLATSILASSLAFVDGSALNVGLPAIARSFPAGAGNMQWVINAYLLPFSALQLLGGALGDRFGRRSLLIIGVLFLAVGSAFCASSAGLAALLAARTLQGAGSAFLLPNSLAILGATFAGRARGRAVGIWAAATAAANAIGPTLGGWLIDTAGWRAVFLVNLPLAAVVIGLSFIAVHDADTDNPRPPLDLLGAVLVTIALGGLVWGLSLASGVRGWISPAIVIFAGGIFLMSGFVIVEARRADFAMMPLPLFGSRILISLNLMTFLLYGVLGGFLVLLPFVLIEVGGYSPLAAGAALLPFPIVMICASPVTGRLAGRFGTRPLLIFGSVAMAAGLALATRLDARAGYWDQVLPSVLAMSVGLSAAAAPLTTAILSSVDAGHTGAASGLNSALARTGGLVAIALISGVLAMNGAELIARFHIAALGGAIICFFASACAFCGLRQDTLQRSLESAQTASLQS